MSNLIGVGENQIPTPIENKTPQVRLLYEPQKARQKLGTYFIDSRSEGVIREKGFAEDLFDGKDLEVIHQKKGEEKKIKRTKNKWGRKVAETHPQIDEESKQEIEFIGLVREYHQQVISDLETDGQSLKDNQDKFLDSLSIGILYKIYKETGIPSLRHTLNFPELLNSEQFKTAKKTALLSLAEASLDRMDGPKLDELDKFQKYLEENGGDKNLTDRELKNLFIINLEDNPEEFLQKYLVEFRFGEEEIQNSRNIFKLGELVAEQVVETGKTARSKVNEVSNFLPYQKREQDFSEKRYWGAAMETDIESSETKSKLIKAIHIKDEPMHRTNKALADRGVVREDLQDGGFFVESEFIDTFGEHWDNPAKANQMVLGMLYSMRHELGVGVLPQSEVLRRAETVIPELQRVGNDLLIKFLDDHQKEFFPEVVDIIFEKSPPEAATLKKDILDAGSTQLLSKIREDKSDDKAKVTRMIVNSRRVDGFAIGEIFGDILKKTASEKKAEDVKSLTKLKEKTDDENAVMGLLIEGKEIEDPGVSDRVERTMKKTSRLVRFLDRSATKAKVVIQDKLFYSEGESPFMAAPSVATEAKSAAVGAAAAISFGHLVNYVMEDPVNRGVQAGLFVAGYFVTKEGGAYIKEIKAKKKELGLEKPKQRGKVFSAERKRFKGEYKKELKAYKKEMKLIKREVGKKFWHNKGKMLYSSGSYLVTSLGVNYFLQKAGLSGSEAPMVLAATNIAVSGMLSAGGLRSGAEFIVNSLGSKKAVDGTMALLTDHKDVVVGHDRPLKPEKKWPKIKFRRGTEKRLAKLRDAVTNIKYVSDVMERHAEENRHLQMLERFVERKKDPKAKFTKDELIETVEFLNQMKEEEGMLRIHNSRYYAERKIRQPDGSFVTVDNKKGMENIDATRREVVEYAQNNLPKEDYDEVVESSLDFFSDVKTLREKVFYRRMKYLVASYGYRVTFMVMSHALQSSGGLLEKPLNTVFGNATMEPAHVIGGNPTEIFHADISTPAGVEHTAKEVFARTEELNNLVNLMGTSDQLSQYQPGIESNLTYYGVTQAQVESIANGLKVDHNMNTSDLYRMIYVLSSYKEGQEYLASLKVGDVTLASKMEGSERRNLAPLFSYLINEDPYVFMEKASRIKGVSAILTLKYPDLAEKMKISPESVDSQLSGLNVQDQTKAEILDGMRANHPIVVATAEPENIVVRTFNDLTGREHTDFKTVETKIISVGNIVSEFADGMSTKEKAERIDFLTQMDGVSRSDSSMLQLAMNSHFGSFLADSNHFLNINDNPLLTDPKSLPSDSMIYKIYQAIDPQTDKEIFTVTDLLNKAKSGDVNSYAQLVQMVSSHVDEINTRQVFDSQVDSSIYDRVLNNLPGEEALRRDEIIRRLQENMLSLGLRPISTPSMGIQEVAALSRNPDINVDPREALIRALSPDNSDLEMQVSLTSSTSDVFVTNKQVTGVFESTLQINTSFSPEDLAILKAIEGSESENNQLTFPKIIYRNLGYALGFTDTASGATPPAGSLIEMMTGPFGVEAMNPNAPAALHNYNAYGPEYLTKLIIAHYRGRVPAELLQQMGPDADLTQSIHGKDPTVIDRFCNKFETLIAAKVLVDKYGEDKVHEVFLNHVTLGTVDGVGVKGVEAASIVMFDKPFKELTLAEKFIIEALGQSPGEYLYDNKFGVNDEGQTVLVESIPNPAKAIRHALELLENQKAGSKLAIYLSSDTPGAPSGKDQVNQMIAELHNMEDRVADEGWEKVFPGGLHLPATVGVGNFAATPGTAEIMGMNDEQIKDAIARGRIISITYSNDGARIIELADIETPIISRNSPEDLMTPAMLTEAQYNHGQLEAQYSALLTDSTLGANFYTTKDGVQVPAWRTEFIDPTTGELVQTSVPGMAIVSITGGQEHVVNMIDPTGSMNEGPQLVGSIFKPLVVFYAVATDKYADDPTRSMINATFDATPATIDGLAIKNSMPETDYAGSISLAQTLSASANVPMAHLWAVMRDRDPNFWENFQKFSREQWGIVYYEVNDQGDFVPRTTEPLSDAGFGNLYVGGIDPKQSGLVPIAEAYQKIGEAGYMGKVSGIVDIDTTKKFVDAGKLVLSGLTNEDLKRIIPIWDESQIAQLAEACGPNGELCAGKTGTQSGVDKFGNWIAIRAGTFFIKYYPETGSSPARVDVLGVMTAGKNGANEPTELDFAGQEVLPLASKITRASGIITSPEVAQLALNELFTTPESSSNYQLGAIDAQQLFPFLRDLSPPNEKGYSPYTALYDAIVHEKTKYLFVDLIGLPNGDTQSIAVHIPNATGVDQIFILNVSANIIEPAGSLIGHFSDNSDQAIIYDILANATQTEPAKYGGLLSQFQGQGINFVSLHDYEASPALFRIHEQMERNGMLFSGAEDSGAVMEKLGLDPRTTVFVNDELFKSLNETNTDTIKEQLFIQREYLAIAAIYENGSSPGSLDTLLYDPGMNSNPAYQLIRLFAETKTSQVFEPLNKERMFLVNQLQGLINNPEKGVTAPDVITAYNLYNEMSSGIARGEAPTQAQSDEFIRAMSNFSKTTKEQTLLSLGIGVKAPPPPPPPINATPLPQGNIISPAVVDAAVSSPPVVEAQPSPVTSTEIANVFLSNPEKFVGPGQNVELATTLTKDAQIFTEVFNSGIANNLQGEDLKNYIIQNLESKGLPVDDYLKTFISQVSYRKQCVEGYIAMNQLLVNQGVPGFVPMDNIGLVGKTAKSVIMPLVDNSQYVDGHWIIYENGKPIDSLFRTYTESLTDQKQTFEFNIIENISELKAGDTLVITSPWEPDDLGHIAQVLWSGTDAEGPYVAVFDANGLNKEEVKIRIIRDLVNDLIPAAVIQDAADFKMPLNPMFATVNYVSP